MCDSLNRIETLWEFFLNTGTVKWFNPKKGYGFISPDNGDKDVFVHITALKDSDVDKLFENDKVEFDTEEKNGKTCVRTIKKIG